MLTPRDKTIFTWDKHIYSRLIVFFRFAQQFAVLAVIDAHVVAGVLHSCVGDKKRRRVVSCVNEGVFRQGVSPNHVSFTGAAYVEHGVRLEDELFFVGHDGWRRQSGGN